MQVVIWGIKDIDRVMWEVLGNGIDKSFRGGWAQHFRQSKSMCKGPEAANILLSPQNCQKKQCGLKGNMYPN